jgi:diguanylate cyclase (GGDEF)-like protein/PAS domain S-box-containing protein
MNWMTAILEGIVNSPKRTSALRPKLLPLFGLVAAAIAILGTLSWFQRSRVDEAYSNQVALNRISALTRQINSLTLMALQKQELTGEQEAEMRFARQKLHVAVLAAHLYAYQTTALQEFWPAFDNYIIPAERQWLLIEVANFDEAKQMHFQSVGPQFDFMQRQLQLAIEAEGKWGQIAALEARYELLAAAILVVTAIWMLFFQLQKEVHLRQLHEAERIALGESEERFRALTEQSADIILIADSCGRIKYASPSIHTVLAVKDNLTGTNIRNLVHPNDQAKTASVDSKLATHGPDASHNPIVELRLRHADGTWRHFECVVRNLLQHKNISGIVYNARDITERKYAQEKLLFSATHDVLTGLPNRALFLGRLQSVVDQQKRHPHQYAAVLFVDIDDFKLVNDCYGHAIGDAFIKEVSNRLQFCTRSDGTVARMGGDEFTILVEDISDPSDAIRVAERIQSSFRQPFLLDGLEIFKCASIGIALTSAERSAEAVLQNADIAMYRAKDKGKACSELFDRKMHEQVINRLRIEAQLRHALENEELSLHYQPIVAVETGSVQGFEALLRWRPSESDSIPPSSFVPIAEQCGLIVPVSIWVLKTACLEVAGWRQRYPEDPPLYLSINVSAKHFSHAGFVGHVKDALRQSAVDPGCITIELTESVAMNDVAASGETMMQLRALGVKVSIDDFGTGYSSLSYLRRFPVDTLKIDQSFVKTMDAENYSIVRTIIGLAHNLDLKVVAEGVETINQRQLLALAGCDFGQGHLFAKPMPSELLDAFIRSNRRKVQEFKHNGLAHARLHLEDWRKHSTRIVEFKD